jgi:biotin operon repressor
MVGDPKPIPVGQEPPPLRPSSPNGRPSARHQGDQDEAKGKSARRKAGDRFAVLNAFVDAGMVGLSKVEAMTWLVLYRDTRDGTACTSMASIAGRIGCSRQAVLAGVKRLRRLGLLVQVFKGNNLRGPSIYRVWPTPRPPKR